MTSELPDRRVLSPVQASHWLCGGVIAELCEGGRGHASAGRRVSGRSDTVCVGRSSEGGLRFEVLGPVRAWRDGDEVHLGKPQDRAVLGLLLVAAGRPVTMAELIDVMWGDDPPDSAVNAIHRTVGILRRLLEPDLAPREAGRWLARAAGGYRIAVADDELDLLRFRTLVAGSPDVGGFVEALGLWQGPVLAGLASRIREHPSVVALDWEYQRAAREAADRGLAAGVTDGLLAVVRRAGDRHPLDEALQARVMLLLAAVGRQAEALDAYRRVCDRLADELGVDPGAELRAAQRQVLRQSTDEEPESPPAAPQRPAQLPRDLAVFVGRDVELARVMDLYQPDDGVTSPTVISAIGGMAGIGKTTLALHWAHRVAHQFPDGQLYLNLRGFDSSGQFMASDDALVRLLDALGVPEAKIPVGGDAKAALFRSQIWGRKMLLLLDNARDEQQVRGLLPASPGCLVIVTSRNRLAGLVAAEGAVAVTLDVLTSAEAQAFLTRRLGSGRVEQEPDAVNDIITFCGRLPLALAVVAARAALRPQQRLTAVAEELREASGLDAFSSPDVTVNARAVFSWSYAALGPVAARVFRLLAVHPGPDVTIAAAASIAGITRGRARAALDELAHGNLVTEHVPGRYQSHDLLRAYAGEVLDENEDGSEAGEARQRMLDYYLHSAVKAKLLVMPGAVPVTLAPPAAGVSPEAHPDAGVARSWLSAEMSVLIGIIDAAYAYGFDSHVWKLTWATSRIGLPVATDLRLLGIALAAAERLDDQTVIVRMTQGLAQAALRADQFDKAEEHSQRSLDLAVSLGDESAQARAYLTLAQVYERIGESRQVIDVSGRALELALRLGAGFMEAVARGALGWGYAMAGEYAKALAEGETLLALAEKTEDPRDRASALNTIGYCHLQRGDHSTAIPHFRAAIALLQTVRHEMSELALCWEHLGDAYIVSGDDAAAREAWQQAVTIAVRLDAWTARRVRAKLATS